ncbi:MAG: hypothetical protein Q4C79_05870 [Neisseria sp.]|uniref:lipopolysaccharide biosynthesis protein n=1 Tax=Neisseria sp. TaxID=192066 RepID=UPI0026DC764E|nr:hypothetical protein [Neisseria sp.]MDO4248472.1 hypothetical protein [Neisseria sp.]
MLSTAKATFIKNFSSHLLWQIVTVVSGFILPPLIISHYGSTVNGFLASSKHFIFYLSIVEAGIGAASIAALYQPLADKDLLHRNRILGETRKLYRLSGTLFIAGLLILAASYSWVTRTQIDSLLAFQIILILGITSLADFFFIGTYRVLLVADQKTYVYSLIQSVATLINVAIAYWLIIHNHDVLTAQYSLIAATLIRITLVYCYIRYAYRNLKFPADIPSPGSSTHITQKREAFVQQLCLLAVYGAPIAYIVLFCSLKDASIYAIYYLVFAALKMLLQSISNGTQAVFGKLLAEQSTQVVRYHYHRYDTLFLIAAAGVFGCTSALLMPFIDLYTRNMTDAEYYQPVFAFIFLLASLADCLRLPGESLIQAAGHFKATRNRYLLEAGLHISITGVAAYFFGLQGVVTASLIVFGWRFMEINSYIHQHILNLPLTLSLIKYLTVCTIAVLFAYGLNTYLAHYTIHSYIVWLSFAALCALAAALLFLPLFRLLNRYVYRTIYQTE